MGAIEVIFEVVISIAVAYFLLIALCPISKQLCDSLTFNLRLLIAGLVIGAYFFLRYKVFGGN